jgi:ATP-dependent DNA ligase
MLTNKYVQTFAATLTSEPLEKFVARYEPPFRVEPKFDGERVFCLKNRSEVVLANRYKTVYDRDNIPQAFVEALMEAVKAKRVLLDGEFVALGGDLYGFLSARRKEEKWKLGLVCFDLLELNGRFTKHHPLSKRRTMLEKIIKPNERVWLCEGKICHTIEEIREAFQEAVNKGFEGVVVKPLNLPYTDKVWCKVKKLQSLDAVIMAAVKTPSSRKGQPYNSYLIGLYDKDGHLKPISKVSSGLERRVKEIITKLVPLLKTGEDGEHVYLEPRIVVEVAYHSVIKTGLRAPRMLRVRFDKPPAECTLDQLPRANFFGRRIMPS